MNKVSIKITTDTYYNYAHYIVTNLKGDIVEEDLIKYPLRSGPDLWDRLHKRLNLLAPEKGCYTTVKEYNKDAKQYLSLKKAVDAKKEIPATDLCFSAATPVKPPKIYR